MRPLLTVVLSLAALAVHAQPILTVEKATPGVTFTLPLAVELAPGEGERLFVVEKGRSNSPSRILTLVPGDAAATLFLDLSSRTQLADEGGLLGLAFHPDYETNGRLFVSYTAPPGNEGVLTSRISEYQRSATVPLTADPASERVILEVAQPADNHNGGTINFGPDGTLYISLGDGGGGGDPFQNGQDPTTLLGTILRIDIDDVPQGETYGIPADNPFAPTDGPERDEIWAYGLRNPYKFSVDGSGLWAGDVGQGRWEEVDFVEPGKNYGWNEVEGPECYQNRPCDLDAYASPVVSYDHGAQGGQSITGGYVVQATESELFNRYIYGDFISGRLWAISASASDPGEPVLLLETVPDGQGGQQPPLISSIDPDPDGFSVLLTDYLTGTIYRLTPRATSSPPAPEPDRLAVMLAGANPGSRTAVRVDTREPVRVRVFDVRGRHVATLWDGPAAPATLIMPGLAPGVYLVRAETARQSAVLQVSVVR